MKDYLVKGRPRCRAAFCVGEIMKDYLVYLHTTPSGKRYVGITRQRPEDRWGHGANYKRNEHFYNAIQKYGWENIAHEVLAEGLSKDEACALEISLIEQYKSHDPRYGYNLTTGGEHYEFSEEAKEKLHKPKKLSQSARAALKERARSSWEHNLKGRRNTTEEIEKMAAAKRGRKMSEEERARHSKAAKDHWEKVGGFSLVHRARLSKALKGRTFSEETLAKMKLAHAPDKNHRSRAVAQIKDGEIIARFVSAREAMRETGVHYTSIIRICNGTRGKSAGGFQWKYV